MNVIQVSYTDSAGKRFNGYDIARYMNRNKHDAKMFVLDKHSDDANVRRIYSPFSKLIRPFLYLVRGIEKILSIRSLLYPAPLFLFIKRSFYRSDLVHLHLLQNSWFSILAVPLISRMKPTIWTLHNVWHTTGHCIQPINCSKWKDGCKECHHLKRQWKLWKDNSNFLWKLKMRIFSNSRITLVVSTDWMKRIVENSPILSHLPVHVIPFGVNIKRFEPLDKETCKKIIGVPKDALVISFRDGGDDEFKGRDWLVNALKSLNLMSKKICLLVFDSNIDLGGLEEKYIIIKKGWVYDEMELSIALNASDIFLMPSLAESFGMMALEAMACGTPVITTEGIATAEIVEAPKAGLAVPPNDAEALKESIEMLIGDKELRENLGKQGRRIAEEKYTFEQYIDGHLKLYEKVIDEHKHSKSDKLIMP